MTNLCTSTAGASSKIAGSRRTAEEYQTNRTAKALTAISKSGRKRNAHIAFEAALERENTNLRKLRALFHCDAEEHALECMLRDVADVPALKKQLVEEMKAGRILIKEMEEKGAAAFMSEDEEADDWGDLPTSTTPGTTPGTTPAATPSATPSATPPATRRTPSSMSRRAAHALAARASVSSSSSSASDSESEFSNLKETVAEAEAREQRELLYDEHKLSYSDITKGMTVVVVYDGKAKNPGDRPIEEHHKGIVERKNRSQGIKVIYPDDDGSFQWEDVAAVLRYTEKFDEEITRTRQALNPSAFSD